MNAAIVWQVLEGPDGDFAADGEGRPLWACKDGRVLPISEMEDSHLQNSFTQVLATWPWRRPYALLLWEEICFRDLGGRWAPNGPLKKLDEEFASDHRLAMVAVTTVDPHAAQRHVRRQFPFPRERASQVPACPVALSRFSQITEGDDE